METKPEVSIPQLIVGYFIALVLMSALITWLSGDLLTAFGAQPLSFISTLKLLVLAKILKEI